ncbi:MULTISPECIES: hypothetical protein [Stenotrophomonas]|uniref:hypothetical protein n=1 Tax=Stenotrophomonas TaxID=40323 RepID=UPI0006AC713F|nr:MULTISPECIES: hypothetical protein [Stenotrophomonas]KOQ62225.1 hypothetical protein ABW42_14455 [Stenotrophomonas maltophilia]MCF3527626.1 hypothetical protein [Stenotrophomonas maltophilia]MCF3531510.1 hypothetical protein [Stenotrophomonas maltophilia]OFU95990.1 hypothetical protein HMPREF3114_09875 [Stenotrophomonas sp. HMSC10F07]
MSRDPWVALEAQRRRRHWRQWPWGLIALGLSAVFTVGLFCLVLIGAASVRPPGDGGSVLDLRAYFIALVVGELLASAGCVASAVLAWRLNHGKVPAGLAIILLSLWIGTLFYGWL